MFCQLPKQVFHTWGKWTIVAQGEIHRRSSLRGQPVEGSERVVGQYLDQQRQCECCGLTQIKRTATEE